MADTDITTTNFDAELLKEEIASGQGNANKVDVNADYERSKEFDVAEIDRTGEGEKAAAAATAPEVKHSSFGSFAGGTELTSQSGQSETGNPEDFLEMAKEINRSQES